MTGNYPSIIIMLYVLASGYSSMNSVEENKVDNDSLKMNLNQILWVIFLKQSNFEAAVQIWWKQDNA